MFLYFLLFIVILLCWYIEGSFEKINFQPHYSRLLTIKKENYQSGTMGKSKTVLKLGQRKLLFTEIEFYTEHIKDGDTVVYAGSAEGFHSTFIMEMFPNVNFIYYDIRDFYEKLYEYKNLKIIQKYFTNEEAQKYAGKDIIFLSDIRSGSEHDVVIEDMEWQREWCEIMKPKMAMLKFRLPWRAGKTKYFDGKIYTQPRIGVGSTETRLWTDCKNYKEYDHDDYNNRVYFYNKYVRDAYHEFPLPKVSGMDHCHDCWSEYIIAKKYIESSFAKKEDTIIKILTLYDNLNQPPHGYFPDEKDINLKLEKLKYLLLDAKNEKIYKLYKKKLEEAFVHNEYDKYKKNIKQSTEIILGPIIKIKDYMEPLYSKFVKDIKPKKLPQIQLFDKIELQNRNRSNLTMILEFLEPYKNEQITCVMIMDYLTQNFNCLFEFCPNVNFIIFYPHDPIELKKPLYVEIPSINKLESIKRETKTKILFYLDIYMTSALPDETLKERKELLEIQELWIEALKPDLAFISFFTFFSSDLDKFEIKYYDGEPVIIPWAWKNGVRMKLITDCKNRKSYNWALLYKQIEYFNRAHYIAYHKCLFGQNIDFCYHCWREQEIYKKYTKNFIEFMNSLGTAGGNSLAYKPHGLLPNEKNRTLRASRLLMEYELESIIKHSATLKYIDISQKSKFPYRWKYEDLKREITKEFF